MQVTTQTQNKAIAFKGDGVCGFNLLISSYIKQAKLKNRPFELTKEQFKVLVSNNCFYCNHPPSKIKQYASKAAKKETRAKASFIYNGVDRVDNSKGYILENCVSCCTTCNQTKMDLSKEEFLNNVKNIYNYSIKPYEK